MKELAIKKNSSDTKREIRSTVPIVVFLMSQFSFDQL